MGDGEVRRGSWYTHLFENQIEFIFVFEELDQLQNARMSLAMMKGLHFAENTGTCVTRNFIDDFHRILQICVNVYTRLDRCICTFAQNITGQFVHLCQECKSKDLISFRRTECRRCTRSTDGLVTYLWMLMIASMNWYASSYDVWSSSPPFAGWNRLVVPIPSWFWLHSTRCLKFRCSSKAKFHFVSLQNGNQNKNRIIINCRRHSSPWAQCVWHKKTTKATNSLFFFLSVFWPTISISKAIRTQYLMRTWKDTQPIRPKIKSKKTWREWMKMMMNREMTCLSYRCSTKSLRYR